jgi:hypothetical protein
MDDMYRDDIANGGATFGPDPRRWRRLVDEFNQANDLLPPTHPNGPRRIQKINPEIQVRVSAEMRRQIDQQAAAMRPLPPTERGWIPIAGATVFRGERGWTERQCEFWDEYGTPDQTREADVTFENETRPLR